MRHILYTFVCSMCGGIAAACLWGAGLGTAAILLGVAVAALCAGVVYKKLFLVAVVCAAVALGIVRADMFMAQQAHESLARYVGDAVALGVVLEDPDRRERALRLLVSVTAVDGSPAEGTLLVLGDRDAALAYGDVVELRGRIALPQAFETDTGHTFDYPQYLHVQGVSAYMSYADVRVRESAGWSLVGTLFSIKHTFERSIERLLPEPEGALMAGMLLGEKHGIPDDVTDAFVASGLIHVVVLSGYNIAIVADAVFRGLAFLPRTLQFGVGGVLMVFFALMAGSGAATVRALLMALITLVARYYNRTTLALRALAVAAGAMVLWNPLVLLYDPSFMLSVLATFGLITLSPWVEGWLPWHATRLLFVRSIAASTIAVQMFLLPALLYMSGVLSFFALPANILVLPIVPLLMLIGFVAGVVGVVSPLLGFVPALFADVLLAWVLWVADTVAHVPFSVAIVPEFSGWFVCAAYIPLTWFAILRYQQNAVPTHSN